MITSENNLAISENVKNKITDDPGVTFLDIYLREMKNVCPHKNVLFIITKTLSNPEFPSTGEWVSTRWHIRRVEHVSAINKNILWYGSVPNILCYWEMLNADGKQINGCLRLGWDQELTTRDKRGIWGMIDVQN